MNKQKAIEKAEVLEKELAELKQIIEAEDKPKGRWKPEKSDRYYYTTSRDNAAYKIWWGGPLDRSCFSLGNCYRTEEEAKQILKNRKTHIELQDLADAAWAESGKVLDWCDLGQYKYFIYIDYDLGGSLSCSSHWYSRQHSVVYFPSKSSSHAAIETIGADRIKAYIKGGLV